MDEVGGLGGDGGQKGPRLAWGSLMYVNGRDIRNSWGNAVRGRGGGWEAGASGVEMEKPGEKESREVTPSEVQGSQVKTSTERQDSRMQGTVGVTLYGEEGDVEGGWGGEPGTAEAGGP